MKSCTYNPAAIAENGRDRMRFELGDTMIPELERTEDMTAEDILEFSQAASATCALSDEEYDAALAMYPDDWRRAKLFCLESIVNRFRYEVDTKVGPLSLSLRQRAEMWEKMLAELKKELAVSGSSPLANPDAIRRPPYFYMGLHDNPFTGGGTRRVF